jgi:hypothetical protein
MGRLLKASLLDEHTFLVFVKLLWVFRPTDRQGAFVLRRGPNAFDDRIRVDIVIEETQLKSRVVLHGLCCASLLSASAPGDDDGKTNGIGQLSSYGPKAFASHS